MQYPLSLSEARKLYFVRLAHLFHPLCFIARSLLHPLSQKTKSVSPSIDLNLAYGGRGGGRVGACGGRRVTYVGLSKGEGRRSMHAYSGGLSIL